MPLLKAEVIYRAALALKGLEGGGVFTTADMHAEFAEDEELKRNSRKRRGSGFRASRQGLRSTTSSSLAGFQSVKPDRMVMRFIEEHAGLEGQQISTSEATRLIREVADLYPTQVRKRGLPPVLLTP